MPVDLDIELVAEPDAHPLEVLQPRLLVGLLVEEMEVLEDIDLLVPNQRVSPQLEKQGLRRLLLERNRFCHPQLLQRDF